jgi:hypothetical protein
VKRTRTTLPAALAGLWLLGAGCAPGLLPLDTGALDDDPGAAALRALLAPGRRVALREARGCDAVMAPDLGDLLSDKGRKLGTAPAEKVPSLWRVDDARVRLQRDDAPGLLAVRLVDDAGAASWIRFDTTPLPVVGAAAPTGRPFTCLVAADDAILAAAALAGKKVVFAPWKDTCTRLEATGAGAMSTLLEGDAGAPLTATGLVSLEGNRPWVGLERDTVRVPHDVLRDCFADAAGGGETRPRAFPLVHTALGRCVRGDDAGKEHLECRSTLGVWEGQPPENDRIALRLVRRTLGPVHFTDGRPVTGARYARTLVAVSTGKPADDRARALYAAMEASIARTLAEGDGSIRVASASDPKLGYRLQVDAADLRIGELERRQVEETSVYQDGERDVPNPAYARAQASVRAGEDQLETARRHHAEQQQEYEKNKENVAAARQTCLQACDVNTNAQMRAACKVGCEGGSAVGGALNGTPAGAEVDAAELSLRQARDALAATPTTVKEPIMKRWAYAKIAYSRPVSASLRLTVEPKGGAPRTFPLPLALTWKDDEIHADAPHNVRGHDPDRGPIDHPEAVVSLLAAKASEALAERLRAVLEQAELDDAKKALAGGDPGKPGFEAVEAKALDAAGPRLRQAAQRGSTRLLAGVPLPLPSEAVTLGPGDCVLAIAVAEETSPDTIVTLSSEDGAFADLRGKHFAAVEACQSELPSGQDTVRLGVKSASGGDVRWGLYRTSGAAKRE